MQCRRCQQENPPKAKFCLECGASLAPGCAKCGTALPPGAKFCPECGQPVSAGSPVSARILSPESYTPKHLAEKILTSRATLEGERKQVTVLFADIKGSLELLEGRDPEEARAILDPALHTMIDAVHRYEGTVNQVLGDGIMALFGAPLAHEDHAVRAGYAALKMQEAIRASADELRRRHGINLQIRVGLNSGEVVVRGIGNDLAMDYTAVGQTTHLAARMEQLAGPGRILVTRAVARLAEGFLRLEPLGPVPVKGLADPVEVFELAGVAPARTRLQAAAARGLTRFVGRQDELEVLRQALERARLGRGQVVALVGEPGVGKSRLCREFACSRRTHEWLILESRSVSHGRATPYLPVLDLLKAYFQIEESDDGGPIREKVIGKLFKLDEALMGTAPAFLALLGMAVEDPQWHALDPHQRGQRTLDALKRLLIRESRVQPVLVVFENLHWIDADTQALLDNLVESVSTARLLLLVTYRPEYQHRWAGKSYYTQLGIDPLPAESASVLLEALLGGDPGLEAIKRVLIDRSGGNPFFLEESVRTFVETEVLVGERGAYRTVKPVQSIQVPATVQAVLASRIDRLPPEEKRLLQSAAVIGKHVATPLLQAIAGLPEEALRRGLADLQAGEFLYEASLFPEVEYGFKHNLTQEVAYGTLLQERRRALHALIVEAIESLSPDRIPEQIEQLAHHAFRGEVWAKAVTYLRQAGAKAFARSANKEAVAYFEQALVALKQLPESGPTVEEGIDLRFDLLTPLLQLGRLQELFALSQEAETMAQQLGDRQRLARVYTYLINYYYLRGEPDRAIEYGGRCLAIAEAGNDLALQALARRYMGHGYHALGNHRQAESILRKNLELLEASTVGEGTPQTTVSYVASCGWLAFALTDLGEFEKAKRYLENGQQAAEAARQAYSQAIAWALAGLGWIRSGHPARAVPLLERSLQACRENHLALWLPIPSSLLGQAFVLLGRVDEALPLLEDGVALSEEVGVKAYLALWTTGLAEGLLAAGHTERALAAAQRALDLALAHKERGHQAWALRLLGEIAAHGGAPDVAQAEGYYGEAIALAEELGMRPVLARSHLGLGQVHRRSGNLRKAEEHLTSATSLFLEMDMRFWLEQTIAELKRLGQVFIVAGFNVKLYDFLKEEFSGEDMLRVILDRRREERRAPALAHHPERRGADRRRRTDIHGELRSRGLVIITRGQGTPQEEPPPRQSSAA